MRGAAAQVAAWGKVWPRSLPGPFGQVAGRSPVTFPTSTNLQWLVEVFVNGAWVDMVALGLVLWRDQIKIRRGFQDGQTAVTTAQANLSFKNANGWFSKRNALSPFVGQLNANTPIRISCDPGSGVVRRFTGTIPDWEPRWTTGSNRWVPIRAVGPWDRITTGSQPLKGALTRAYEQRGPVAWWPLEEDGDATSVASAVAGGKPMEVRVREPNQISFGSYTDLAGVARAPEIHQCLLLGYAQGGSSTAWTIEFAMKSKRQATALLNQPFFQFRAAGSYHLWQVLPADANGTLPIQIQATMPDGTTYAQNMTDLATTQLQDGRWHHYSISASVSGGVITLTTRYDGTQIASFTMTGSGLTLGALSEMAINPNEFIDFDTFSIVGLAVFDGATASNGGSAFNGWLNESPLTRFARLCAENGISYVVNQLEQNAMTMGAQRVDTLPNLLIGCAEVAGGFIDETFNGELRINDWSARWNREAAITLDYTAGDPLDVQPSDDTTTLRNRWTIQQESGSSRTASQTTGALGSNTVGIRDDSATLSTYTSDQAYIAASLRVARGTIDKQRMRSLVLDFTRRPSLIPEWLAADVGSRVTMTNQPSEMGPGTVDQYITGYLETGDQKTWTTDLVTLPSDVDRPGALDDAAYFLDCPSTVRTAMNTSTTTLPVTIIDPTCSWVHSSGDYVVTVGLEEMTVTNIAAAVGSSQDLTVTRGTNGVTTTHAVGEEVHVRDAFILVN